MGVGGLEPQKKKTLQSLGISKEEEEEERKEEERKEEEESL